MLVQLLPLPSQKPNELVSRGIWGLRAGEVSCGARGKRVERLWESIMNYLSWPKWLMRHKRGQQTHNGHHTRLGQVINVARSCGFFFKGERMVKSCVINSLLCPAAKGYSLGLPFVAILTLINWTKKRRKKILILIFAHIPAPVIYAPHFDEFSISNMP